MANYTWYDGIGEVELMLEVAKSGVKPGDGALEFKQFLKIESLVKQRVGKNCACVLNNWIAGAREQSLVGGLIGSFLPGVNSGTIQSICATELTHEEALKELRNKSAFLADLVDGSGNAKEALVAAVDAREATQARAKAVGKVVNVATDTAKALQEELARQADKAKTWLRVLDFLTSPLGVVTVLGVTVGGAVLVARALDIKSGDVKDAAKMAAKAAMI